jgi:hypothetical protein
VSLIPIKLSALPQETVFSRYQQTPADERNRKVPAGSAMKLYREAQGRAALAHGFVVRQLRLGHTGSLPLLPFFIARSPAEKWVVKVGTYL